MTYRITIKIEEGEPILREGLSLPAVLDILKGLDLLQASVYVMVVAE